ncbi:hypothetical protein CC80DRAFT_525644, partial [Byssothecium circinans]
SAVRHISAATLRFLYLGSASTPRISYPRIGGLFASEPALSTGKCNTRLSLAVPASLLFTQCARCWRIKSAACQAWLAPKQNLPLHPTVNNHLRAPQHTTASPPPSTQVLWSWTSPFLLLSPKALRSASGPSLLPPRRLTLPIAAFRQERVWRLGIREHQHWSLLPRHHTLTDVRAAPDCPLLLSVALWPFV